MTTIKNGRCGCFDLYFTLNSINVLITPVAMRLFGYLAFQSMKRLHTCVRSTETRETGITIHQQERHFLVMVLAVESLSGYHF
jgi:hypothetical protein